jgi:hypothetical protein
MLLAVGGSGILGTLPGWLTFAGVILAAWIFYKGGGGTAISSLQAANTVLEKRVHDLETQARHDNATIAELRGRTDVSIALKPILEWTVHHEARAQQRHEEQMKLQTANVTILEMVADRLGPEPNGHSG